VVETWPSYDQFQLLELSKVVDLRCNSGLNERGLSKDSILTRSAGEGYSH
jgi:hypothetical protein